MGVTSIILYTPAELVNVVIAEIKPVTANTINLMSSNMMLKIVKKDCLLLKYINEANLTKELVLASLEGGNLSIDNIGKFNDDEEVVLKICSNNYLEKGDNLLAHYASNRLLNDKEFIIECIEINPFEYAKCYNFKDDEQVALVAASMWGGALYYATARVRNIYKVALEACKCSHEAIKTITAELLRNKSFILDLIRFNREYIAFIPKAGLDLLTLTTDLDLILGLGWCSHLLAYLPNFASSKVVAMHYITIDSISLKYFSAEIKDDKEIALLAVRKNLYSFRYISKRLHGDKEVVVSALSNCRTVNNNIKRTYVLDNMSYKLKKDSTFLTMLYENSLIPAHYAKLKLDIKAE